MRLDEATPLLTTVATPRLSATLSAWHVGQHLDAVVTRITNVGTATINVNNTSIDIHTELALTAGSKLLLEVVQIGSSIALRVLPPPVPKDAIAEALRVLAPRQSDLAPVLTELAKIAQPALNLSPAATAAISAALATATPELRELAKSVIERLRTPAQTATPDGLKQAIKNAGPFFEHQLATASGTPDANLVFDHDLKAGLLQLVSYLKAFLPQLAPANAAAGIPLSLSGAGAAHPQAPLHAGQLEAQLAQNAIPLATLAKEVDAALARITTQQLLSLPERSADAPQWIFDLPLRSGERIDVFHLHIFREKHPRDAQQPPAWCVRLTFDLISLGKVNALMTLFANTVSVSLWAQQPATARLFDQHLAALRNELQTAGVAISRLHCECGDSPFSPDAALKQKRSGLIDERA